jgi:hypothetical protein
MNIRVIAPRNIHHELVLQQDSATGITRTAAAWMPEDDRAGDHRQASVMKPLTNDRQEACRRSALRVLSQHISAPIQLFVAMQYPRPGLFNGRHTVLAETQPLHW